MMRTPAPFLKKNLRWVLLFAGLLVLLTVFAAQIVREGDLQAYRDIPLSPETQRFREVTAAVQRVELNNGRTLYGWRARNFIRHVRSTGRGEFCTCSSDLIVNFFDGSGNKLAAMNFIMPGDVYVHTDGDSELLHVDQSSQQYIREVGSPRPAGFRLN